MRALARRDANWRYKLQRFMMSIISVCEWIDPVESDMYILRVNQIRANIDTTPSVPNKLLVYIPGGSYSPLLQA